jgi:hypothetical protein
MVSLKLMCENCEDEVRDYNFHLATLDNHLTGVDVNVKDKSEENPLTNGDLNDTKANDKSEEQSTLSLEPHITMLNSFRVFSGMSTEQNVKIMRVQTS